MRFEILTPRVEVIGIQLREQGRMGRKPMFVLSVFAVTVILWLTSKWHGIPSSIVALFPLIIFFGLRLLKDEDLQDLGWGILFTIGGGMSLGIAMRESGLSDYIVSRIPFEGLPVPVVPLGFALAAAVSSWRAIP